MNRRELLKGGLAGLLPVWASKMSLLSLDVNKKRQPDDIIVLDRAIRTPDVGEFISRADGCAHLTIRFPQSKWSAEGFVTSVECTQYRPSIAVDDIGPNTLFQPGMVDPGEITMTVKLTGPTSAELI